MAHGFPGVRLKNLNYNFMLKRGDGKLTGDEHPLTAQALNRFALGFFSVEKQASLASGR